MKNVLMILALSLIPLSACGNDPYKDLLPVQFDVTICSNVANMGATASTTGTTEKEICGDEIKVLQAQFNFTRRYQCSGSGCNLDEANDLAVKNVSGGTIRLYLWKGGTWNPLFGQGYCDITNPMPSVDSTGFYHPTASTGCAMGEVLEKDHIFFKGCKLSASPLTGIQQEICSETKDFVVGAKK